MTGHLQGRSTSQVADRCGLWGAQDGDKPGLDSPGCPLARSGPTILNEVVLVGMNGIFFLFLNKVLIFFLLHKQGKICHRRLKKKRLDIFELTLKHWAKACTQDARASCVLLSHLEVGGGGLVPAWPDHGSAGFQTPGSLYSLLLNVPHRRIGLFKGKIIRLLSL